MIDHAESPGNIRVRLSRRCGLLPNFDGYEAIDKVLAIVGPRETLYKKAVFLRTYTSRIVLFPSMTSARLATKSA